MYVVEVNKYGLKDFAISKKVTKLHAFINRVLQEYELEYDVDKSMSLRTLQIKLKNLAVGNSIKVEFMSTKISILKAVEL